MRWQVTLYDREEHGFFRRPGAETRLVLGRVVRGSTSAPYQQSLDGYARGVELLVQRKSTSGISGWLSYSFGRNRVSDQRTRETYWGDLDQRHTLNLYVFYRISDRTSVSAKLRAGSNVPAPGYYTQAGRRILRLLGTQRRAAADLFARRRPRQPHVQLVAQAPDALRRDHERAQPRQRPLQPAGRQHRHGARIQDSSNR